MNKQIIPIIVVVIIIAGIGACFVLQKPASPEPQKSIPYYFIAIHNEPYHFDGGEKKLAKEYNTLKRMVAKADQYNIKLTLMFTAQWADYISESPERMADLESWKKHGHEIAAHHHSIYHRNWDGYTNYSKEEAKAQRREQGFEPEEYLGTFEDYINKLKKINPDIKSCCCNEEHDKKEMPDEIIYSTCSGFANCGEVGTRLSDVDQKKGKNEYILTGTANGILRKWVAHYQITTPERQKIAQTVFDSMNPSYVYGVVTHSASGVQEEEYYDFLEFLHSRDTEGKKSRTVSEIIDQKLLPEETISTDVLNQKFQPITKPQQSKGKLGKCGDGICDELEKRNPNLCPNDCEPKNSYEDSPFGFHPANVAMRDYPDNGFIDAENIGVRWTRQGLYVFWFKVQPDINKQEYDFTIYDNQWKNVPTGINILANIAVVPVILAVLANPRKGVQLTERNPGEREKAQEYIKPGSHLPSDEEKYLKFVRACVERYDGDGIDDMPGLKNPIKYWQVGNEPPRRLDDFAELQKITYDAIKEACPDCKVLIGGVPGMPHKYIADFDKTFLPILNDLANSKAFDIFDFHWYGNAVGDYKKVEEVFGHIKGKIDALGLTPEEYWITEMGSYSGDPTGGLGIDVWSYQTETQQAGDYLKRFVFSLSLGIKKIFPAFGLIEGFKHDNGYFDLTGLIYDGEGPDDRGMGVKKLAYYTYKLMTEKLEGSTWDDIETVIDGTDNIYAYKFIKNSEPVWVLWWDYFDDTGTSKIITLNVGDINLVKITEAVPDTESRADLNDYDYPSFFKTETKTIKNGEVTITLKKSPIFVEVEWRKR